MRLTVLVIALAALLCACGAPPGSCKVVLSGAVNQTLACTVKLSSDGMKTAMTIETTGTFNAGIDLPADLLPQDYTTGAYAQFVTVAGGVWNESLHHTDLDNHPDKGDFLIHFTSTGSSGQHAKGTVTATMPADGRTGAQGTVTAVVTFTDSTGVTVTGSGGGAGGGAGGGSGGGGGSSTCTVTISGGVTASTTCNPGMTFNSGSTYFSVNSPDNVYPFMTASLQLTGAPATGTFEASNAAVFKANMTVATTDLSTTWYETYESGSAMNRGTFSLRLTSVGTADPVTGLFNNVHGTLSATATFLTAGARPDAQVAVTF